MEINMNNNIVPNFNNSNSVIPIVFNNTYNFNQTCLLPTNKAIILIPTYQNITFMRPNFLILQERRFGY